MTSSLDRYEYELRTKLRETDHLTPNQIRARNARTIPASQITMNTPKAVRDMRASALCRFNRWAKHVPAKVMEG